MNRCPPPPGRTLLLLLLLLLTVTVLLCDTDSAAQQVRYDHAADALRVNAEAVPLQLLLEELAEAAGIAVEPPPDTARSVSASVPGRPLAAGLRQLARALGYDHLLRYDPKNGAVTSLRLVPRGAGPTATPAPVISAPASRPSREEMRARLEARRADRPERPERRDKKEKGRDRRPGAQRERRPDRP